jgi:IS5 family transposase
MLRKNKQLELSEYAGLYDIVVPKDNLLRKINEHIDFSFVNEMLRSRYCETFGRPAKEPEMMFKIMFLKRMYDLSDEVLVDNLRYNMSFKYFIGLSPEEETIDPSLLTKFRKMRITEDIMEEMLSETMRQAIEKGLIKSRSIIVDSTHTASKGHPETPTQILRRLTKSLRKCIYKTQIDLSESFPEKPVETATIEEEIEYTNKLVLVLKDQITDKEGKKLLSRITSLLEDDKIKNIQSVNDEDAKIGHKSEENSFFGYKNHLAITEERLISGIEVTSGRNADTNELVSLVEQSDKNGVEVKEVIGDMAYSSKDNINYCNKEKIKLISRLNPVVSNGNNRNKEFVYNKDAGTMQCPEGHLAIRCEKHNVENGNIKHQYIFNIKKCKECPRNGTCYKGQKKKSYSVTILGEVHKKQYEFEQSEYFKSRIKERYKIEAKNAELKQSHGLGRCKYNNLLGMKLQMYFTAFVANVKRIVKLSEISSNDNGVFCVLVYFFI